MSTYRVFLGAPPIHDIDNDPTNYQWKTISSEASILPSLPEILPTQAFDDASRRISLVYQNVIFNDSFDENDGSLGEEDNDSNDILGGADQTTAITWLPTQPEKAQQISSGALSRQSTNEFPLMSKTRSFIVETQETQDSLSVDYNDASSIARFPTFHFNLHSLISLTQLVKGKFIGTKRIPSILLAVLEVEGPDIIRVKNGKDAGREVGILKMILGDEGGTICKLTAWREVAERWGGGLPNATSVKRGDIVLIENVTAVLDSKSSPAITASPYLKSNLTICYRTMPYTKSDSRLRPDLRLGRSDAAVRRVADIVLWFENLAGLEKS
ncbi:hypothetical protein AGABI1DRAFT_117747 [Agaricus bisporus var. burnettii JB137-S8]|uniref:OB domain-containing protein n=2 Tax=Agaricus bisporus var. burnettii TaxID=192524 RepID=K5Y7V0_AGABU|nr:uncharacterized protein AGABI1DRAFT_117747 [Agaricus bisporus var. burnettii JB137-S8]EKM84360.1 hypothetical protein AGABI1DRAFT_117747 [Agaricus bisporus var. burnettii JB137-S8]KAF7784920.1 hypothetical protein Agabi119p4_1085 [Agaricus bisporus var. burnettii]